MARPWILDYDSANCAIGATVGILGERPTLPRAARGLQRRPPLRRHAAPHRHAPPGAQPAPGPAGGRGPAAQGPLPGERPAPPDRVPAHREGPRPLPGAGGADGVGRQVRGRLRAARRSCCGTATAASRCSCRSRARRGTCSNPRARSPRCRVRAPARSPDGRAADWRRVLPCCFPPPWSGATRNRTG